MTFRILDDRRNAGLMGFAPDADQGIRLLGGAAPARPAWQDQGQVFAGSSPIDANDHWRMRMLLDGWPRTLGEEADLTVKSPGKDGNAGNATVSPMPETQIALNELERRVLVGPEMERAAKATLNDLTGGALPQAQIDSVYDQVIKNISLGDAWKFKSIDPTQRPMALTPEQKTVVDKQVTALKPSDRATVQEQLDIATKSGKVTCPACGK